MPGAHGHVVCWPIAVGQAPCHAVSMIQKMQPAKPVLFPHLLERCAVGALPHGCHIALHHLLPCLGLHTNKCSVEWHQQQ